MQNVSDKFIAAMRTAPYAVRLTLDGTDIIQGGPMLDGAIQSMIYSTGSGDTSSVVTVGSTVSTSVTLELDRSLVTVPLKGRSVVISLGMELEGGTEWLDLGSDIVTDVLESDDTITVTCHTALAASFEVNYKPIAGIDFSGPVSALALASGICARHGVAVDISGLEDIALRDFDPDGCTDREIIGWLAALYGKFTIIDRTGTLRFRWFEPSGHTISADDYYDGETEKSPEAIKIAWIQCYAELLEETLKAGDVTGEYGIACSCPWMTQERLEELWAELDGFAYTPAESISVFGDPRIDLGDTVTLETLDGGTFAVPVMYVSHDWDGGIITDISAQSQNDSDVTEGTVQRESKRTRARIVKKQNAIEMAVEDAKGNLSKLEQTAGEVHVTAQKKKILGAAYSFDVDGNGNLVLTYTGDRPGYSINDKGELVLEYEGDTPPDTWIDDNGVLRSTEDSAMITELIGTLTSVIDGGGTWETEFEQNGEVVSSIRFDLASRRFAFDGDIIVGDTLRDDITKITKDTIDVKYLNTLGIKAGSVDAENITGTTITGKKFVGATGEFSGVLTAGAGSSLGGFKTDGNSLFSGKWASGVTPTVFMCTGTGDEYTLGGVKRSGWVFGAGTDFGVASDGKIYCTGGKIAGWTIDDNSMRIGTLGAVNSMWLCNTGTTTEATIGNGKGDQWCIAVSDKFGVKKDGTLYCKDADLIGKITATGGQIGDWNISEGRLSNGSSFLSPTGTFMFGTDTNNFCGFQKVSSGVYNFLLTGNTRFQIGETVIDESKFKKLLALIGE